MKTFRCVCENRLFFDNSQCLRCRRKVGFSTESMGLVPLEGTTDEGGRLLAPCKNYGRLCNWLVHPDDASDLCLGCRLNVEVPESGGQEDKLLSNVEIAKRRLIFTLLTLDLPVLPKNEVSAGMGFALRRGTPESPVITGHADGLITLDLNEADPAKREAMRASLGEDYRTLLGHFRHEVGHYYWNLFFVDEATLAEFREMFGDERVDYGEALAAHYANPRQDYQDTHVSSYATAHPWEDWAETWAHYLHIFDSWETGVTFGFRKEPKEAPGSVQRNFDAHLDDWSELMIALNSMNRSMGHDDAYPFQLAPAVRKKLGFVDQTILKNVLRLQEQFPVQTAKPLVVTAAAS